MTTATHLSATDRWLPLPLAAWQDTHETLHLWTQIIGKIRLALAPKMNHWWHSTLYVTPRGLTTGTMPVGGKPAPVENRFRSFQITFDFLQHQLLIETSDGMMRTIALAPCSVAAFYRAVMSTLKDMGIEVQIWTMPQEIGNPIRFDQEEICCLRLAHDPSDFGRF